MSDKWWRGQGIPVRSYYREGDGSSLVVIFLVLLAVVGILLFMVSRADAAELWKITAYCACEKCCSKKPSDPAFGITASGKKAEYGMVACNWLPFGTKVHIKGLGDFKVQDRGAKSLFGSKTNHIRHIDVYMTTHKQALQFGVKYMEVSYAR